jgi:hypothetical protein
MKRHLHAALAAVALLACTTAASAEIPRFMRLEYKLEGHAARCPAEQVFRDIVGKEAGFDPFVNDAQARLVVTVTYRAGLYLGRAELHDGTTIVWEDPVKPVLQDCRTAIHALGVAVAIELDAGAAPPAPKQPAELPSTPKPLSEALPRSERQPTQEPVSAASPLRLRWGFTTALALWIAPSDLAFEWAAEFGLRWRFLSISTELRGSPPSGANVPLEPPAGTALRTSDEQPGAYVSTSRLAAAIVPCMHWELSERWHRPTLLGCGVVQGGGMFGTGGPGVEGFAALPYLAAGPRFVFELDIIGPLSARLGTDVLGVLHRPVISLDGRTAFETRPYSMTIGLGLGGFF